MVPGINADHIPEVAKKVKELGAYIVNIIPMIPVPGTKFENLPAPTAEQRKKLQDLCEPDIKQMRHCRFCRADAIGLLGEDRSAEFAHFTCQAQGPRRSRGRSRCQMEWRATSTGGGGLHDGKNVDLHFGQAKKFFGLSGGRSVIIGRGHRSCVEQHAERGPAPGRRTRASWRAWSRSSRVAMW